ncbi:MAG: acyl dehydratase [Polaromonas sp.]|nr:acyl dehydratase [Polaromonas sp.]
MSAVIWETLQVGDTLPVHHAGPVSRSVLSLFAGGSGDHNPIHLDVDFARQAGFNDVFAHGMLSMAYLGQLLSHWAAPEQLRAFSVRFAAITPVNARVTATGSVVEKFEENGEQRLKLAVQTALESGEITLAGEAVVAFS